MTQNSWYKGQFTWWQCVLVMFFMLLIYHFVQPKVPKLGMVNIQEISQDFLEFLAAQTMAKEEQTYYIETFGHALDAELTRLSKEVVLFESHQVVTPLPDYTEELKQAISQALPKLK
ncbi:MAG: TrbI F-type domain-containing protein [Legionellales bacterium]|jgi:hypothetical protein